MDLLIDTPQWEVRPACPAGWEVRLTCYKRMLRSILEILEAVQSPMDADGLTEELRSMARASIELEDAWGALALKTSASLMRANVQCSCQPEGRGGGDRE